MKLDIKQKSQGWLDLRKEKIGASDISSIMGHSPWRSAYDLWQVKMGMKEEFFNSSMQHGVDNEFHALRFVEHKLGIELESAVFLHDAYSYALASLDGISKKGDVIVEVKCPGVKSHAKHKSNGIPLHYQEQIQWQMFVTGIKQAVFASWYEGDLYMKEVIFNKEMIESMLENADHFYYKHMLKKIPPSEQESPYENIEEEEFISITKRFKELTDLVEGIEREKEDLKKQIIEFSGGYQVKTPYIKVRNSIRKGSIDEERLISKSINPDDFRKPSTYYQTISAIKTILQKET